MINAEGTLSGNFSVWQFTGVDPKLRATVQCSGSVSPGYQPKPGSMGTMKCYAEWTESGKKNIWNCRRSGELWKVSSLDDFWFALWLKACVGTVTSGDGVSRSNEFDLVGIKSTLNPTK